MLMDTIQATLASYEGVLFDSCQICPECGGELSGYDVKKKQFAVVMEGGKKKVIHVLVKRFRCRSCQQICLADQPFYPDTRIGSPVVDLCVTLGETMHYPRVSSCLAAMGIIVDRWSVRNYVERNCHTIPAVDMFGIKVPVSVVSLFSPAVGRHDGRDLDIDTPALLAACGYPSRKKGTAGVPPRDQMNDPPEG